MAPNGYLLVFHEHCLGHPPKHDFWCFERSLSSFIWFYLMFSWCFLQVLIKLIKILFDFKNLYSGNVYIELKIENEIITNFDIEKEKKYLLALNNNLSQVPEKKLYELSKNSIINEKIKKRELLIYFDLEKAEMIMKDVIKNFYIKVGFENETQFSNYLKQYEISIDYVKEKLKIETLWNQLIYNKFSNQISVDNNKLKIKMNNELKNKRV